MVRIVSLNKVFPLRNSSWNPPRNVCLSLEVGSLCWEVILAEEIDIRVPGSTEIT